MRDKPEKIPTLEGILLVDKPEGMSSFSLIPKLRKLTKLKKIGHAGTLDPLATGVMVFLIGKSFTTQASSFLNWDKEYQATIHLGYSTTTYDREGEKSAASSFIPSLADIEESLQSFQGTVLQTPPMFSAKKIDGTRLYTLARQGIEVERKSVPVEILTRLISYEYPFLHIHVQCSKGTYIRSLAHDMGQQLGTGAFLQSLRRTRVGPYHLSACLPAYLLHEAHFDYRNYLL